MAEANSVIVRAVMDAIKDTEDALGVSAQLGSVRRAFNLLAGQYRQARDPMRGRIFRAAAEALTRVLIDHAIRPGKDSNGE